MVKKSTSFMFSGDTLEAIDKLVATSTLFETRSQFVRYAVENKLKQIDENDSTF